MRKRTLIYMIMAGTLALSGCKATSQNPDANASAVEQNTAQDGQNKNNDGNGAPDGKEAPDGKGGPDDKGGPGGNGATLTLKSFKLNRTSGDSTGGDQSSFYGIGAAILTTDGTTNLNDGTITTDSKGGAGVFAYGDSTVNISDNNDFFLKCTGNANKRGWSKSGSNGVNCVFTATEQAMKGDIIWDSISTLEFTMKSGSSLTGAIVNDEINAGNGGEGSAYVTIDKISTWTVTGDIRISRLVSSGTIVDNQGKNVTIKKSDGTVIKKGSSCYTITVDSYSAY